MSAHVEGLAPLRRGCWRDSQAPATRQRLVSLWSTLSEHRWSISRERRGSYHLCASTPAMGVAAPSCSRRAWHWTVPVTGTAPGDRTPLFSFQHAGDSVMAIGIRIGHGKGTGLPLRVVQICAVGFESGVPLVAEEQNFLWICMVSVRSRPSCAALPF